MALLASVVAFISMRSNAVSAELSEYEYMPGAPQITVFTHGIADFNGASHWSNTYPETFDERDKGEQTHFAYDTDSLIHKLSEKAGGADIYWAKVNDGNTDFDLYNIGGENIVLYGQDYYMAEYEHKLVSTVITNSVNHIIIVFEASNGEDENDIVYDSFKMVMEDITEQVASLNRAMRPDLTGELKPRINLIGHSRGGMINLAYTLDHPEQADSLVSIGTPYFGSWLYPIGKLFMSSEALDDCCTEDKYMSYYERWNANREVYDSIRPVAIGGVYASMTQAVSSWITPVGTAAVYAFLTLKLELGIPAVILVNEITSNTDVLVPLESALGIGEGDNTYSFDETYIRVFSTDNMNLEKRSVANIPVAHNIETMDAQIIQMVLNSVSISNLTPDEYDYEQLSDGTYRISSFSWTNSTQLNIPSEYKGKPVTEIGPAAFISLNTNLKKIVIPESVTKIDNYAFAYNTGVQEIEFAGNSKLKDIGSSAFYGCSNLGDISLPNGVEIIGDMAFEDCSALTGTFTLPASVKNIYAGAFNDCNISAFTIASSNSNYIAESGVLYEKSGIDVGAKLVAYPAGKKDTSFTIPAAVKEVGEYAIYGNYNLQSINLNNVETILNYGLSNCEKLATVTGNKVNYLGGSVLVNTPWLENNAEDYVAVGSVLLNYRGNASTVDISAYSQVNDFAFALNGNVEEIIAGANTEEFGIGAFLGCNNLKNIKLLNLHHPVYVNEYTFGDNADDMIIEVPEVMKSKYETSYNNSGWDNFAVDFSKLTTNITFDSAGGSACSDGTAYYGSVIQLPQPMRAGYDFAGWYDSVSGGMAAGNKLNSGDIWTKTADNTTLYAKWNNADYIVTLDYDNGTGQSQSIEVTYLMDMPNLSAPTRPGYEFCGYFSEPDGGGVQYYDADMNSVNKWDITDDATLYADWEGKSYTVTLNKRGGTGGSSEVTAIYGEDMPAATAPVREGYVFEGYFTEMFGAGEQYYSANMTSVQPWDISIDTTLYAHWSVKEFEVKVQYNSNTDWVEIDAGVLGLSNVKVYVSYGASIGELINSALVTEYKKTEHGYVSGRVLSHFELNGQDISNIWGNTIPDLGADGSTVVLSPVYIYEEHTISFVSNVSGLTFNNITAQYGANISLPVMDSSDNIGYSFGGWYTDNLFTEYFNYTAMPDLTPTYEGNGNVTLYAKWTAITYTVKLDKQGGSGGTSSVSVQFGNAMPSATKPTKTGYTLKVISPVLAVRERSTIVLVWAVRAGGILQKIIIRCLLTGRLTLIALRLILLVVVAGRLR